MPRNCTTNTGRQARPIHACSTEYHTLARCWHHLTDSRPSCLHFIVHNMSPLSPQRLAAAMELHQQQRDYLTSHGLPPCYGYPPAIKCPGASPKLVSRSVALKYFEISIPTVTIDDDLGGAHARAQMDQASSLQQPQAPLAWYYILHLFSGQRRQNDFQDFMSPERG